MPARPLQSVRRAARFVMGPRAVRDHPELAALMACAITEWARAEANLGTVLMIMTGAKAKPAAAMYGSLKSPQARADTLRAVARVTLDEEAARTFEAVLIYLGQGANIRNRLAHGLWGSSSEIPNALLVMDPDVELARKRDRVDYNYRRTQTRTHKGTVGQIHPKNVFVYFKEDFEEAIAIMEKCYLYTQSLCVMCYPQTTVDDPDTPEAFVKQLREGADRAHNWLRNQPPLQKIMNRTNPNAQLDT